MYGGGKEPTELRSWGGPATLDKCMMGNIQGPGPHHGTGHGAHSSTGGCQRWSNLATQRCMPRKGPPVTVSVRRAPRKGTVR